MIEQIMPPKYTNLEPAPQNIQNMLSKLKELKDQSQLETILMRFYKIHSSDPDINAIFTALCFDSKKQEFASLLTFEKVISLIENKYDCTESTQNQFDKISSEQNPPESKEEEDLNQTIIKKPIPTSIVTQEISLEEPFDHQFLSNNARNWQGHLFQDQIYESKNNSINNSLIFNNNNILSSQLVFSNKNPNDNLRFNSPFHRMTTEPQITIEEFKANIIENAPMNTMLNKKRTKPQIVVNNNELNEKKRSLRASSVSKKYRPNNICKKKIAHIQGRNSGFGLKEISNRVREIIKRSGTTSYKEISDEIVNEINEKDSKDEKNIRRRIYDSLNVMKSMKLFRKDKSTKKIDWTFIDELPQNNSLSVINRKDDDIDQSDHLKKLNQEIRTKSTKFNTLQREFNCLNTVLERNKNNEDPIEEKKKIYFPFIIIEFPNNKSKDAKVKVSMNENKSQAHFAFDSANKLYGDLDAISKIGHNIGQLNFKKKT